MPQRPFLPLTDKLMSNLLLPRGPKNMPALGTRAPDWTLPFAEYTRDPATGEPAVRYGETLTLSSLRGRRVVLSLTRIVSDRFF